MPNFRALLLLLLLFGAGSLFAEEPDRFVDRPVVSFGATEAPRSESQLHGFRDGLTSRTPMSDIGRSVEGLSKPAVRTAEYRQTEEILPEIQQVAVTEPLPLKGPANAPQEPQDEPTVAESATTEESDDEPADPVLGRAITFGSKERTSNGKMERPKFSAAVAPVISVIGSLLIVLSAFFVLMMIFKKISPKSGRQLPKEAFENLGRTFLTPKLQLHLLRLGNRLILVSVTQDGVTPVTEVTDPDEVVPLLGMCRQLDANSSTELFQKMYDRLIDEDKHAAPTPKKPAQKKTVAQKSSLVDLYSEPDESLADILASGLGKGGRNG